MCDDGRGVGPTGRGVYLDFSATPSEGLANRRSTERYGNLFEMYERITGESPYETCRCASFPPCITRWEALWVDYHLMSHHPGPIRSRRSQLLRPWRESSRRQRVDAGPRRRLLRDSVHDRQLPGVATDLGKGPGTDHPAVCREARDAVNEPRTKKLLALTASGRSIASTASSARSCGSTAAWRATAEGLSKQAIAHIPKGCARSSGSDVNVLGSGRLSSIRTWKKPVACRGFPGAGGVDVPGCFGTRMRAAAGISARSIQTPEGEAKRDDAEVQPTWPRGSGRAVKRKPAILHKETLVV